MRDSKVSVSFRIVALGTAITVGAMLAYYAIGGTSVVPLLLTGGAFLVFGWGYWAERRSPSVRRVRPQDEDRES